MIAILAVLTLCAATPVSAFAAESQERLLGDVDGDGAADTDDAVLILKYYAKALIHGQDQVSWEDILG